VGRSLPVKIGLGLVFILGFCEFKKIKNFKKASSSFERHLSY
jgi:hypothetical protein